MKSLSKVWNRFVPRATEAVPFPTAIPPVRVSAVHAVTNRSDRFAGSKPAGFYRILSLDGGGARGIIEARLLTRLARHFPDLLTSRVDLIAGTSTGGLLALLLASGRSPADCVDVYRAWLPRVFSRSLARLFNIESAKYSDEERLKACESAFGALTLGDLRKFVVVPAFRMNSKESECSFFPGSHWRPILFSNIPRGAGRVDPDNSVSVVDVAMSTTAAPTFFSLWKDNVDGGVWANNPALISCSRVLSTNPSIRRRDLKVLSLGAGHFGYNISPGTDTDWGLRDWAPYLLEMLLAGQSMSVDKTLQMLLTEGYHRLDLDLAKPIPLDGIDRIDEMIDMADSADLGPTVQWVERNFPVQP